MVDILASFLKPRFCWDVFVSLAVVGDVPKVRYFVWPKLTCRDVRDVGGVALLCSCEAAEAIVVGIPGTEA